MPGQIFGLLGANGTGKSTLLDLISGAASPTPNGITFHSEGRVIPKSSIQGHLSYVTQLTRLPTGTLREILSPFTELIDASHAHHLLTKVGLNTAKMGWSLSSEFGPNGIMLSGGQIQRLTIARAFLRKPNLLLIDEGTSALDEDGIRELMFMLKSMQKNCTIIFATHSATVVKYCDDFLDLNLLKD